MSSIDETKQFIPLNIAVLTVSDTRSLADDKSGTTLAERLTAAGHMLARARDRHRRRRGDPRDREDTGSPIAGIDVVITTGGTGFTGRDVTPEAVEPLFEKRMDGFSIAFHMLSHAKIGTSTIQSRATAGAAGATFIFCLPGSPGACRDAWDGILAHQLDYRTGPAISSRSCRGSTSICAGRRRKGATVYKNFPALSGARREAGWRSRHHDPAAQHGREERPSCRRNLASGRGRRGVAAQTVVVVAWRSVAPDRSTGRRSTGRAI